MAATLSDIITTIVSKSKRIELCDTLHDAQIAATEEELIEAGLSLVVFAYQTGIVDDALLADFTEAKLNAVGIYTTGTYTLTNPEDDIYILKNATVTVNMTGNNKSKINILGSAVVTIICDDKSYVFIKGYGLAAIDVTGNDDAIINLDCTQNNTATIELNNNSIVQLSQKGNSEVTLTSHNASYTNAKLFGQSILNYLLLDTATIEAIANQSSVINIIEP